MNDNGNLYDTLDLKPDASQQEVREAYVRTKSAYNKDSLALYTLISTEEREEMLRHVEEAYEVLSSPEKRKEYDRCHGLLSSENDFMSQTRVPNKKIISIDRVPPMEAGTDQDHLLVAPSTDFNSAQATPPTFESTKGDFFGEQAPVAPLKPASPPPSLQAPQPTSAAASQSSTPAQAAPVAVTSDAPPGISQEIVHETEWRGPFLKRVRDFRKISIEEMASITKISKTYINAIESEEFKKLPAPVFVRGFIMQVARVLRLPPEQVATPYMARYNKSRGNP